MEIVPERNFEGEELRLWNLLEHFMSFAAILS